MVKKTNKKITDIVDLFPWFLILTMGLIGAQEGIIPFF
jgi:hypothetical protein